MEAGKGEETRHGTSRPVVRLRFHDVDASDAADLDVLKAAYDDVLRPAFPPSELVDYERFVDDLSDRTRGGVVVARDRDRVVGAAVDTWFVEQRIALLGYLAVAPKWRDRGVGSMLIVELRRRWAGAPVDVVVGEVEDPRVHRLTESDQTWARVRFYERLGADALDVPWTQPGLDGGPRVPGFLLLRLWARSPDVAVSAGVLGAWADAYFANEEGAVPRDAEYDRLRAHITGRPLVPVVRISDLVNAERDGS